MMMIIIVMMMVVVVMKGNSQFMTRKLAVILAIISKISKNKHTNNVNDVFVFCLCFILFRGGGGNEYICIVDKDTNFIQLLGIVGVESLS